MQKWEDSECKIEREQKNSKMKGKWIWFTSPGKSGCCTRGQCVKKKLIFTKWIHATKIRENCLTGGVSYLLNSMVLSWLKTFSYQPGERKNSTSFALRSQWHVFNHSFRISSWLSQRTWWLDPHSLCVESNVGRKFTKQSSLGKIFLFLFILALFVIMQEPSSKKVLCAANLSIKKIESGVCRIFVNHEAGSIPTKRWQLSFVCA